MKAIRSVMKTTPLKLPFWLPSLLCCAGAVFVSTVSSLSQEALKDETEMDIPGSFHRYFGQRVNSWKDTERQIAKIDLDADMNQDGLLSNSDPADGGAFESTPPGLIVGLGELSRVVMRLLPYRVDFDGEVVVTLELAGINRGHKTGAYASFQEETASTGRIKVWRDKDKKVLLLDSHDPAKLKVEFTTQYRVYPYNLPIAVPRFFFVEGVGVSSKYSGDVRLLATVSHRAIGAVQPVEVPPIDAKSSVGKNGSPVAPAQDGGKKTFKSFRTSFDHILLTVQPEPQFKEFINNNNEGVWIAPPGWSY
jgi:hypothetical protein